MSTDYTDMTIDEFQNSDHRLAGAVPATQSDADTHRLAGAEPSQ